MSCSIPSVFTATFLGQDAHGQVHVGEVTLANALEAVGAAMWVSQAAPAKTAQSCGAPCGVGGKLSQGESIFKNF